MAKLSNILGERSLPSSKRGGLRRSSSADQVSKDLTLAYGNLVKVASDLKTFGPEMRNPLMSSINFYIPVERSILNHWIRYYFRFHPLVGNAIEFHSEIPISRFGLKGIPAQHTYILNFYEEMIEEMDMFMLLHDILKEFFLLGEAFPYLYWDPDFNCFTDSELINPDFVEVRGHPLVGTTRGSSYGGKYRFELIPDQTLRDFVASEDDLDKELKAEMNPEFISAVKSGKNVVLDTFNMSMISRKQHRYEPRGTSIVLRCLKDLMYEDILREAQMKVAEGHIAPKQIWKLGDKENIPLPQDLEDFRQLVIDAHNDPVFSIVTHYALSYESHGSSGKILPLLPEFEFIYNRILTALFMNKSLAHGEGPNYATASVAMRALMSRYIQIRGVLEDWCFAKVFLPVAVANEFWIQPESNVSGSGPYLNLPSSRKPIVPQIDWRAKANLLDDSTIKQSMLELLRNGKIPVKMICDTFELDYEYVKTWMEKEQGSVFDPVYQDARKKFDVEKYKDKALEPSMRKEPGDRAPIGEGAPVSPGEGGEALELEGPGTVVESLNPKPKKRFDVTTLEQVKSKVSKFLQAAKDDPRNFMMIRKSRRGAFTVTEDQK